MKKVEFVKGRIDCVHNRVHYCDALKELYCAKFGDSCKFFINMKDWEIMQKKYPLKRRSK